MFDMLRDATSSRRAPRAFVPVFAPRRTLDPGDSMDGWRFNFGLIEKQAARRRREGLHIAIAVKIGGTILARAGF